MGVFEPPNNVGDVFVDILYRKGERQSATPVLGECAVFGGCDTGGRRGPSGDPSETLPCRRYGERGRGREYRFGGRYRAPGPSSWGRLHIEGGHQAGVSPRTKVSRSCL